MTALPNIGLNYDGSSGDGKRQSQETLWRLVLRNWLPILRAGEGEESKMAPTFPVWTKGRIVRSLI